MMTVQAPQVARLQTSFAPVRSRLLRRASSRVTRGSSSSLRGWPLMRKVMSTGPGPTHLPSPCARPAALAISSPRSTVAETAAPARPVPFIKSRRENPPAADSSAGVRFRGASLVALAGSVSCGFLLLMKIPPEEKKKRKENLTATAHESDPQALRSITLEKVYDSSRRRINQL